MLEARVVETRATSSVGSLERKVDRGVRLDKAVKVHVGEDWENKEEEGEQLSKAIMPGLVKDYRHVSKIGVLVVRRGYRADLTRNNLDVSINLSTSAFLDTLSQSPDIACHLSLRLLSQHILAARRRVAVHLGPIFKIGSFGIVDFVKVSDSREDSAEQCLHMELQGEPSSLDDKTVTMLLLDNIDPTDAEVIWILQFLNEFHSNIMKKMTERRNSERDLDIYYSRTLFTTLEVVDLHLDEVVSRASKERKEFSEDGCKPTEGTKSDWLFVEQ
ncbi:hypothetical protein BC936DRAFT_148645 [Jimgerdemannia flammicorona]|uniref:Uncharacterized protein n=1 Tax=Jimgerdemannia flammicorona TaxID=994334 RepID=A0A433D2J7_9FUNG|nr:hypothetical protein BC936DRAFT_148645 [Jimgerdemannia flammicorona]